MKKFNKTILLIFIAGTSLFISESKAQVSACPYTIVNNRNCDITILWESSDCAPPPLTQWCQPYPSNLQVIPANSSWQIPTGCCWVGGDVFVWVREISGVDVWTGTNQSVSGSCLNSGAGTSGFLNLPTSVPAACSSPNFYTITWTSSQTTIN